MSAPPFLAASAATDRPTLDDRSVEASQRRTARIAGALYLAIFGARAGLISFAGLATTLLPRWLNVVGLVTAVAGLVTVVPAFEAVEMVFGLGSIVWFIGVGVALLGRSGSRAPLD